MTVADALAQATWFVDRGCSVIPADHPLETTQVDPSRVGKVPLVPWKEFQTTRPTQAQLAEWFANGHRRNIAVVTGAVSDLVIVDGDSSEALAWMREHLPRTPWRVRTAKGEHWGYRHPGITVRNSVRIETGDAAVKIDVRGDGGYVVAPGSLHASGTPYEWIEQPQSLDDLPIFDPAWLATGAGHIAEGARNDALFKEGCRLRRLGWAETEILRALRTLNQERCRPPLDDSEIETIAGSAARYEPAADTFPTTETGDAEFFAERNAETVRYDHRRGRWLLFDGHVWVPQSNGEIARLALESVRARQAAAIGEKDRMRWAIGGEARKRQVNLLALAQSMIPLADVGDQWDTDPMLLGAPNGVVDLRAGRLRPGRPEDRITLRVRAPFDPEARCPLWDRTVAEIFESNDELIGYFDRFVGYSITGDCCEEALALCWGEGANGKGTLLNTIAWLLGDYADDLPFSTFELHSRAGIPNDIAKLVGKRFVTASESGETQRLNEPRVKALTGRDPITARFLHREFFTFQPVAKFWLATNHRPEVRDDSEGFWRRIHLVPFTASFIGREDRTLKDRLREELPGILARAVRGCLAWQREGLNPPKVVREATQSYRGDSTPLNRFLDECCVVQDGARATFGDLFREYCQWAGDSRMGKHEFSQALRQRFRQDERNTQRVEFVGVGLLDRAGGL